MENIKDFTELIRRKPYQFKVGDMTYTAKADVKSMTILSDVSQDDIPRMYDGLCALVNSEDPRQWEADQVSIIVEEIMDFYDKWRKRMKGEGDPSLPFPGPKQ